MNACSFFGTIRFNMAKWDNSDCQRRFGDSTRSALWKRDLIGGAENRREMDRCATILQGAGYGSGVLQDGDSSRDRGARIDRARPRGFRTCFGFPRAASVRPIPRPMIRQGQDQVEGHDTERGGGADALKFARHLDDWRQGRPTTPGAEQGHRIDTLGFSARRTFN